MRRIITVLAAFLTALFVIGVLSGCSGDAGKKEKKDYSNIVENPNIAIPGYASLTFKAGKKEQSVDFFNPEENTCYFRMSLVMKEEDAQETESEQSTQEEKETVLWTSEYLEPGEHIKSISLDRELDKGDYPAILKYECFALKDERQLNGSNVKLTLTVR